MPKRSLQSIVDGAKAKTVALRPPQPPQPLEAPSAFRRKLAERAAARQALAFAQQEVASDHEAQRRELARARATQRTLQQVDWKNAIAHAKVLVGLIRATPGAPKQVRVWSQPGVGVRIYFPGQIGFLSVGWEGSPSRMMRGVQTYNESAMYPAWRRAVRSALAVYNEDLADRNEEFAEHRAELADEMGGLFPDYERE